MTVILDPAWRPPSPSPSPPTPSTPAAAPATEPPREWTGGEAFWASSEPRLKWKGRKVLRALRALHPKGVPPRTELSDQALCNAVLNHLGIKDGKTLSNKTIIRLAGRTNQS